ncbi:hypothetical protein T484DRAFT_1810197 [Baffinella frigidus]|nr:hypothetical protein T484DRAFT_1810197 [Cryptophyta sp. CCMP2293]
MALHLACRTEDVEIVTSLVQAGANVNAIDKQGSKPVAYLTFDPNQRHSTHYYERIQAQLGDIKRHSTHYYERTQAQLGDITRHSTHRYERIQAQLGVITAQTQKVVSLTSARAPAAGAQTQKVVSLTSARAPAAGVTRTISLKGLARVASVHGQLMKLEPPKPPPKGHVSIVFKDEAGELERFETTRLVVMKRRTGRLAKERFETTRLVVMKRRTGRLAKVVHVDLAVSAAGSAILPRSKTAAADAGDKGVADAGDKGVVIQLERSPLAFPFVLGFLENTSQGV